MPLRLEQPPHFIDEEIRLRQIEWLAPSHFRSLYSLLVFSCLFHVSFKVTSRGEGGEWCPLGAQRAVEADDSAPAALVLPIGKGTLAPNRWAHHAAWSVCRRLCDPKYSGEMVLSCQVTWCQGEGAGGQE